ncbi:MAG: hypothetical protein ACLR7J_03250 [[Ruminococcus] torques]
MKQGQTLNDVVQRVLGSISEALEKRKPDIALVHGDTTNYFADVGSVCISQICNRTC